MKYHQPAPVDPKYGWPLACDAPFDDAAMEARRIARRVAHGLPPDANLESLLAAEGRLPYALTTRDAPQAPATWEGSVLPALREVVDAEPAIRGAEILEGDRSEDPIMVVMLGHGWSVDGRIRRGVHEHMMRDVGRLAYCARTAAQGARVEALLRARTTPSAMPCPVCLGDLPSTCRECSGTIRVDYAARALAAETLAPRSEPSAPPCERTPLPDGWTWDKGCACVADGPRNGPGRPYAGVEDIDDGRGTVFTHDNKPPPPDVLAALRIEAKRLGLPWVEPKPDVEPSDYTFEIFCRNEWRHVHVTYKHGPIDGLWSGINYFSTGHAMAHLNASPKRWAGHERAREWAAHLLGEVAPPLREEGASA